MLKHKRKIGVSIMKRAAGLAEHTIMFYICSNRFA
jgi:hypothetical protein